MTDADYAKPMTERVAGIEVIHCKCVAFFRVVTTLIAEGSDGLAQNLGFMRSLCIIRRARLNDPPVKGIRIVYFHSLFMAISSCHGYRLFDHRELCPTNDSG